MSKLNVNLEYEYEQREIEDNIIQNASTRLLENLQKNDNSKINDRIIALVDEGLSEQLADILENIESYEITKSCGYSETTKTTVKEMILEKAAKWLETKVDEKGRTPDYRSDKKMTRLEYIVRSVLDEELDSFKKEVREESKKYLEEYDKKVRDIIAENVKDIVTKINSK